MEIFVHRDGQQLGPYSVEEVRARLAAGTFSTSDNAWTEGMTEWESLSSFAAFQELDRKSPPPLSPPRPAQSETAPHRGLGPGISRDELGPYARSTLTANETPLHRTVIHPIVIAASLIAAIFLALFCWPMAVYAFGDGHIFFGTLLLLIPAAVVLPGYIVVKTSELLITDRRVIIKMGWLQRRTLEMFISKIESVSVRQGVVGRMFGYGTVIIRGTGGSAEMFPRIAKPLEFRNAIQRVQSASDLVRDRQ